MQKAYSRINWENYPSEATPLNETNLNKIDGAVDEIDNRVITQDTTKLDKVTANTMVKDVSFDEETGIFTITLLNGSTKTIDTKLEKIAVNFSYDSTTQQIILTLIDGTKQYIDMSALITQYEFAESDEIYFTVESDGTVQASVKDGSITEDKLQPNYLADIKIESTKAETSATESSEYADYSKSYAVGTNGIIRENDDIDNAKYYYEQTKQISQNLNGVIPMGTITFANLPTANLEYGWMYNISDAFTSDERFSDGGNIYYGAGNNIIWTSDNKWDVMSGSGVVGIKGDAETTYRQGNVNITPENIGAMKKNVYDSDNNGIVDNAEKLGGQSPSYYQPKTDSTLKTTSKTTTGAINEVYNSTADNTQFIDNLNIVFGTAYSDSTISSTTLGIRIPDLAAVKLNTVFKVTTSMPITSSDISVVFVTGNASMQERSQTFTLYAKGFNDSLFKVSQLSSGRTYSFTMQQNSPNILILLDEMKGIGNSPESFSYESTDKAFSTYGAYLLQKDINKCLPVSKGAVTDSTVTINLEANAMYICYIKTVKVSDGKLYGHRVNMIYVNNEVGVSGEMTAKPSSVNLEASSNLGFTGTLAVSDDNLHATYALTVSATYKIYYALYKIIQ